MRRVILGTDWWTDCDDVAALRICARAHKRGLWQLMGVCIDACTPEPDDAATDRIIAAVEAAKKYDSRFRERQFTPNPASWLNAKGYMNDYTGGEQRGNDDGYAGFTPSGGFGSFG